LFIGRISPPASVRDFSDCIDCPTAGRKCASAIETCARRPDVVGKLTMVDCFIADSIDLIGYSTPIALAATEKYGHGPTG
jgi:hypothetical protein